MTANSTLKELFGSIRAEDLEERTRVVFAKEARNYVKAPVPGAGIPSMPFPTPVCCSCLGRALALFHPHGKDQHGTVSLPPEDDSQLLSDHGVFGAKPAAAARHQPLASGPADRSA